MEPRGHKTLLRYALPKPCSDMHCQNPAPTYTAKTLLRHALPKPCSDMHCQYLVRHALPIPCSGCTWDLPPPAPPGPCLPPVQLGILGAGPQHPPLFKDLPSSNRPASGRLGGGGGSCTQRCLGPTCICLNPDLESHPPTTDHTLLLLTTPYTLHPMPRTLHPTPTHYLHTTHYALRPYTLHLRPYTLHLHLHAQHPTPLYPTLCTLHYRTLHFPSY